MRDGPLALPVVGVKASSAPFELPLRDGVLDARRGSSTRSGPRGCHQNGPDGAAQHVGGRGKDELVAKPGARPAQQRGGSAEPQRLHFEEPGEFICRVDVEGAQLQMATEIGCPLGDPSHSERLWWFDHHLEGATGKRPGAHPAFTRDLNRPRGVGHEIVLGKCVSIGDPVRYAAQRSADGQRDIFRRSRGAEHAQGTHRVVATTHAIDQARFLHPPKEVCGGRLRLPDTNLRILKGECRTAIGDQLVCERQASMW